MSFFGSSKSATLLFILQMYGFSLYAVSLCCTPLMSVYNFPSDQSPRCLAHVLLPCLFVILWSLKCHASTLPRRQDNSHGCSHSAWQTHKTCLWPCFGYTWQPQKVQWMLISDDLRPVLSDLFLATNPHEVILGHKVTDGAHESHGGELFSCLLAAKPAQRNPQRSSIESS